MLPGATEAATIAKVGGSVVQGLQRASQPLAWPNSREALLELHAILDEWCTRARNTTMYVEARLNDRRLEQFFKERYPDGNPSEGVDVAIRQTNIGRDQIMVFGGHQHQYNLADDVHSILHPKSPLLKRWQASSRRAAARRSLRTVLSLYAPKLLEQFEVAIQARVDWLQEYQDSFDRWFDHHTEEDAVELIKEMDATLKGLEDAESGLRRFILENFSLSDID